MTMDWYDKIKETANTAKETIGSVKTEYEKYRQNNNEINALRKEAEQIEAGIENDYSQIGRKYINHVIKTKDYGGVEVQSELRSMAEKKKRQKDIQNRLAELEKQVDEAKEQYDKVFSKFTESNPSHSSQTGSSSYSSDSQKKVKSDSKIKLMESNIKFFKLGTVICLLGMAICLGIFVFRVTIIGSTINVPPPESIYYSNGSKIHDGFTPDIYSIANGITSGIDNNIRISNYQEGNKTCAVWFFIFLIGFIFCRISISRTRKAIDKQAQRINNNRGA